jgi:Holliday junction DNA helicase RuvA
VIVSLKGILVSATPLGAVLDVNGIGYQVHVPLTTAEKLPAIGKTVMLHTVAVYREDSQSLYGFATEEDRDFFQLLVGSVSGVGPKVALTIMSRLSLPVLRSAIQSGDVGLLSKCHGIGKKTAERIVVELKDKIGLASASAGAVNHSLDGSGFAASGAADTKLHDAVLALTALGYKVAEAEKAVRRIAAEGSNVSTEELVKRALAS